jgi:hypothetical protein
VARTPSARRVCMCDIYLSLRRASRRRAQNRIRAIKGPETHMLNEFQSPRRAKNKEEQMCMCYVAQIEPLLPAIKRTRVCPATGAPAIQTPAAQ